MRSSSYAPCFCNDKPHVLLYSAMSEINPPKSISFIMTRVYLTASPFQTDSRNVGSGGMQLFPKVHPQTSDV